MNTRTFRFAAAVVLAGALAILGLVFTGHHHYKVQPGGPNIPASQTAQHADPDSIVGDVQLLSANVPFIGVESKDVAGYQTTRWVDNLTVTTNAPTNNACAHEWYPRSHAGGGFAITLGSAEQATTGTPLSAGPAAALGFSFVPSLTGCGLISPAFNSNLSGTTVLESFGVLTINPGDEIELNLHYDKTPGNEATTALMTDLTTGKSATGKVDGAATYKSASAAAGFGPFTPTGTTVKLLAVRNAGLTTYSGHSGSLGAFAPQKILLTSDGTTAGVTYAYPKTLWNGGLNFSVEAS